MITFEEYENALKQRHGERIHNILSHSSVAIAGLGGLGSNIAMYLARAGPLGYPLVCRPFVDF